MTLNCFKYILDGYNIARNFTPFREHIHHKKWNLPDSSTSSVVLLLVTLTRSLDSLRGCKYNITSD